MVMSRVAVKILCGHALDVLRNIPDETFQAVVTSPPYWGLRDYSTEPVVWGGDENCNHEWGSEGHISNTAPRDHDGAYSWADTRGTENKRQSLKASTGQFCLKCGAWRGSLGLEPTPEMFVAHLVEVFQEVRRTLRDDGTLWLNLADSYWGGKGKSGYELPHEAEERRAKGETFQAAHNVPGYMDMRPADGKHTIFKPKDLVPISWMVAMALQRDGWWLRSAIIWEKPNCMPASVRDRPTTSHEYVFLLAKNRKYYYDQDAVREPVTQSTVKRCEYSHRVNEVHGEHLKLKGNVGQDQIRPGRMAMHRTVDLGAGRNKRTVWTIPTKPFKGAHFATYPPDLVEPCIKAGTSEKGQCSQCGKAWVRVIEKTGHVNKREPAHVPNNEPTKTDSTGWAPTTAPTAHFRPACTCFGDPEQIAWDVKMGLLEYAPVPQTVLDPFGGSGTTALVAEQLGRNSVLIELNPTYAKMAKKRIMDALGPMFTTVTVEEQENNSPRRENPI